MNSLFIFSYSSKSSTFTKTRYSLYGLTQPFARQVLISIVSITGQYFANILSLPSRRSKVAVRPKINWYFTTSNNLTKVSAAYLCASSSTKRSYLVGCFITVFIICTSQFNPNPLESI